MNQSVYLIIGLTLAVIGALPFGLVNLSVLNIAFRDGVSKSMKIAYGATIVELIFGGLAIFLGTAISSFISANPVVNYVVIAVVGITGLYFFFKSEMDKETVDYKNPGVLKGIVLNAISLQVLLYWLLAVSFIYSNDFVIDEILSLILFLGGIVIGKIGVLYLFAVSSKRVMSKSKIISNNINRIIGIILLISVLIQLYRI